MSITAPYFLQQLTDNSGKPLSGGKIYTYVGGSTNLPKTTYYDKDYTIPAPNPLICDASGTAPQYFLTSGAYKFAVYTSNDVLVATRDWIYGSGGATSGSSDDHKVAVDGTDTNPGYLSDKIIGGGAVSVGTVNIPGVGLKTTVTGDGRTKTTTTDSLGYLENKIIDSPTITWETVGGVDKQLKATVNDTFKSVIPVWAILKTTDPTTAPFGLSTLDLQYMYNRGYGVASSELQTTDPMPMTDLSIWYLEGGTYWGDATWVERGYLVGQAILNLNHGLYDYMTTLPEDPSYDWTYSNYPAGLYILANDTGDGYLWRMQVVKQYPDPDFSTDSVLTYNGFTKTFNWTATSAFEGEGTVKVQEADTPRYLEYKVQGGPGITVTNVYNGVYGNFLSISASGSNPSGRTYASTMYVANATHTLAPNLIARSELVTLFVPTTDIRIYQGNTTKFGCFMSQGGTGQLRFTLRDEQYRLVAASYYSTNPQPQVFLELSCGEVWEPTTQTSIPTFDLLAGGRYYLGILWDANGIQMIGDDAVQTVNTTPLPALKVDNLLTMVPLAQLTGGSESKMRPFVRILTSV